MCGNSSFQLVSGYFSNVIQPHLSAGMLLGGPAIPTAVIVCTKCGFISQHALGVLGLLPSQPSEPKP